MKFQRTVMETFTTLAMQGIRRLYGGINSVVDIIILLSVIYCYLWFYLSCLFESVESVTQTTRMKWVVFKYCVYSESVFQTVKEIYVSGPSRHGLGFKLHNFIIHSLLSA